MQSVLDPSFFEEDGDAIAKVFKCGQATISRVLRQHGIAASRGRAAGERHGWWRGGRIVSQHGYVWVIADRSDPVTGPMVNRMGYVLEHRLVMARSLCRPLRSDETVHHINGDKLDNRIENLQLRVGKHGKGVCLRCSHCGSTDLEHVPLAEAPQDLG